MWRQLFLKLSILSSAFFIFNITTGCALSSKSAARAELLSPDGKAEELFEILDVNHDGLITPDEARSGFQYLIASYDRPSKTEILAAKPVGNESRVSKRKARRRPTSEDAKKAFDALFVVEPTKVGNGLTQDEFKKLVVKASDNPETDPFAAFF
jgi:hypothetical protein